MISSCRSVFTHSVTPIAIVAACGLAITTLALAHEQATGVVKERMDLMKRQRDDMKLIGDMAKGKTKFDPAKAAEAARDIVETSHKIPELFPKGSAGHPSEAKEEIWAEWDSFTAKVDDLGHAADALVASLDGVPGNEWKPAFQKVGEACKACHKSYRMEKEGH
jgi:cytochrome c556